jgi:heptosyltransferase I
MNSADSIPYPRALIVRLGAMGDVLHALPAVALLRRSLPHAHIGWVVEQRWRELLCAPGIELAGPTCDGRPLVDELHRVDTRAWRRHPFTPAVRREFLSAIGHLRARHYDAALDLQGAIKSALVAQLSGARLILGFRHPREALARLFYHSAVEIRPDSAAKHVIEQNLELVQTWLTSAGDRPSVSDRRAGSWPVPASVSDRRVVPWPIPDAPALLPRHHDSEAFIDAALHSLGLDRSPIAILNPGAGWAAKQWAPSRYGELAIALAGRGLRSLVNFGPGEQTLASQVVAASKGAAQPFPTSLSQFIALARRARLCVAGDTGPMHLAALLGVPTVALFGPTDPARNGPYWPGTRVLRDPASISNYSHKRTQDPGLDNLTVQRVLGEIDALSGVQH